MTIAFVKIFQLLVGLLLLTAFGVAMRTLIKKNNKKNKRK